uniref:Uncharacterized protein n=1 Tax=Anguilla anguilla TaxID=7936 RepID=A0A0E9P674_ANGAN
MHQFRLDIVNQLSKHSDNMDSSLHKFN